MSSKILIVEKTGVIKESIVKSFVEAELYKKAGLKVAEGFERVHEWTLDGETVVLYGKSTGRAGQENKYDFPPPVDKMLFFGACILTSSTGSLKKGRWEDIYEELFGGFEDIGDEDSEDSEEEDEDLPKTKSGYTKDGFIVDDSDETDSEEYEEEDEPVVQAKKPTKKGKIKASQTVFVKIDTDVASQENLFLDCTSELEEDVYEE
jgi:ATP-dependent helicase YprA (DUF1998 family)